MTNTESTSFTSFLNTKEARALLLKATKVAIKDKLELPAVELIPTATGIALKLHNQNLRPTVYSVELELNPANRFVGSVCLDTIINERSGIHKSLKLHSTFAAAVYIVNTIAELACQECDGTPENTLLNYTPIGLLYISK